MTLSIGPKISPSAMTYLLSALENIVGAMRYHRFRCLGWPSPVTSFVRSSIPLAM